MLVGWWVDLNMKNTIHSIIGWCGGLAIGMTIGVSQSNIMLGIGLGVAFGASLVHIKRRRILQEKQISPQFGRFLFSR